MPAPASTPLKCEVLRSFGSWNLVSENSTERNTEIGKGGKGWDEIGRSRTEALLDAWTYISSYWKVGEGGWPAWVIIGFDNFWSRLLSDDNTSSRFSPLGCWPCCWGKLSIFNFPLWLSGAHSMIMIYLQKPKRILVQENFDNPYHAVE